MTDKQFYAKFLRQANKYIELKSEFKVYICDFASFRNYEILEKFSRIVSKKIGYFLYYSGDSNRDIYALNPIQRKEVMTELISYLKDKLNQLK